MKIFSGNRRKVIVSVQEVREFMARFPCSGLHERSYWFEFATNGDLVDTDVPEHDDGPGALALSNDAQKFLEDNQQLPSSAHTAGPWKTKSIPGHLFEIHDENGDPVLRIRGGIMPTLADAQLLAAAPDLLAALTACVAYLRKVPDSKLSRGHADAYGLAFEALHKATGKKP